MKEKKLIFLALFATLGFVSLHIPFTKLAGSNVSFTLFDFFGPIAGAFLGPVLGVVSVLLVEFTDLLLKHAPLTTGSVIRLFPMLFAVYYFAVASRKKDNNHFVVFVPLLAITMFIAHPIGKTVWYYSLFWLIPVFAYVKRNNLLLRSLGSTFSAHAVGGALWIWSFNLPAVVWKGLIPTVIEERTLFALGIAFSYIAMQRVLSFLIAKKILPRFDSPALTALQ